MAGILVAIETECYRRKECNAIWEVQGFFDYHEIIIQTIEVKLFAEKTTCIKKIPCPKRHHVEVLFHYALPDVA